MKEPRAILTLSAPDGTTLSRSVLTGCDDIKEAPYLFRYAYATACHAMGQKVNASTVLTGEMPSRLAERAIHWSNTEY